MTPVEALQQLGRDPHPFPNYTQQDSGVCYPHGSDPHGNVCWNDAVEDLVANHSHVLARYELAFDGDFDVALRQICETALLMFAAGGCVQPSHLLSLPAPLSCCLRAPSTCVSTRPLACTCLPAACRLVRGTPSAATSTST